MLLIIAAADLALSEQATANVIAVYVQTHDFRAHRTFAWAGEKWMTFPVTVPLNIEQGITTEIRAAFGAKACRYAEALAQADFSVSFSVGRRVSTEEVSSLEHFWVNQTNWCWGCVHDPAYAGAIRSH